MEITVKKLFKHLYFLLKFRFDIVSWYDAVVQKPGFSEDIRWDAQIHEKTRFLWSERVIPNWYNHYHQKYLINLLFTD